MPKGEATKTKPKASSKAPKAEKRANKREAFLFEGSEVRAGTAVTIRLPVARLPSGSWIEMPVVVIHGTEPGPCIWLSGAIHGDELNGVEIVRRLVRSVDPKKLRGTILAVPIVNVFGVTIGSRYLPDRRDLNRSFPGSAKGSMASRMAHLFFERVVDRCEIGIDFHTGSGGRSNWPQIRCNTDNPKTKALAETFATSVVVKSGMRDGSLRAAAGKREKQVLLYEAGEAFRFDEQAIALGVEGTQRVLASQNMLELPPETTPAHKMPKPIMSESSSWLRAGRSGFCHLHTKLGASVKAGDRVATVADSVGTAERHVKARNDGVVIGILQTALIHQGEALLHIADIAPLSRRPR